MQAELYSELAIRTANPNADQLTNALLGIAGESGEICDYMKKVLFHDKVLDRQVVIAELGDLAWYMNQLMHVFDTSWEEVFDKNIKKLSARYPDLVFDAGRANNRDTAAEMEAMKG